MSAKKEVFYYGTIALFSLAAMYVLFHWFDSDTRLQTDLRLTDTVSEEKALKAAEQGHVEIEGFFKAFAVPEPAAFSGAWPGFRGAGFDNIASVDKPLASKWGNRGPEKLWTIDLGEGHGGAAVLDGRVYLLDYDEEKNGDALRCFSLETGKELWRRWYEAPTKRNHGRSRTVPMVTADYIVSIGPRGFVLCVETETGAFKWGLDLVDQYGTEIPHWYTAQCPIIQDGVAVIAPAGTEIMMMGIDCETGKSLWTTRNTMQWKMSHASILPVVIAGKKTFVYVAVGGVLGVSAEAEDMGTLLWSTSEWKPSVAAPTPIAVDSNRLFLTAGYGAGSCMLRVDNQGGWKVEMIHQWDKSVFSCEQQTPILWKGHLFSVLPKDAGANRAQFLCMDLEGNTVWQSGKEDRYGLGPFLLAGDRFLVLNDNGMLSMIKATLTGFELLAQHQVLDGHDAWGPMAFVDGKLLLRDSTQLACLDLRKVAR